MRTLRPVEGTIALLLVFASVQTLNAQAAPFHVHRVAQPIRLDGRLDDPAWADIEPLTAVQALPNAGAQPSERTEFLVAYDDDYLYFGGRLFMADSSLVQATSLKRDVATPSNDFFVVLLDCFRDRENALAFGTNPAGIRFDAVVPDDAATEQQLTSWNTFWDVAVDRTGKGWFVEMRVPFSSLRFQPRGDSVVMGLTMFRWISRKVEVVSYPAVPDTWGMWGLWKASQTGPIVLEGVKPQRSVYVTPYGLGGVGSEWKLNENGDAFERVGETAREVGLDLKYGITSNLTLDATMNPDFAQVEADDEQVNLTRFSLFFPEKRLFFQERASVFEVGLGGSDRLFYSRRVGLDAGRAVRILGGARLIGRVGEWDVGMMDVETQRTEFRDAAGVSQVQPAENLGVLRLRRRVWNDASYLGGLLTSRTGAGGHRDVVAAGDAIIRVFGQDFLTLQIAGRTTDAATATSGPRHDFASAALARVFWERRSLLGWQYTAEAMYAGPDFDASLGFLPRHDFTRLAGSLGHGWHPSPVSPVLEWSLETTGSVHLRNSDGAMESASFGPSLQLTTKTGHQFLVETTLAQEDLTEALDLPLGTDVPPGRYRFPAASAEYYPPYGLHFRPSLLLSGGGYYDGYAFGAAFTPNWTPSPSVELGAHYRIDRVVFPDRGQAFTAHVARLRAGFMPNVRLSCYGLVQFNSATHAVVGNLRFRYNPREGNDLYLVYNQTMDTGRAALPGALLVRSRTFMVKYSRTLVF